MGYGGLERIVAKLIKKADANKFENSVCCLDKGGPLLEYLKKDNIRTYILGRKAGPIDFKLLINIIALLRKEKIDIVHSHSGCIFYGAVAGRLANVNGIIHTDHGRLLPDKRSLIFEDKLSSFFLNKFVGVSEELTKYLKNTVGIKEKKLLTVINGVDTDIFRPINGIYKKELRTTLGIASDEKVIGTVCRLEPVKNISLLIESMRHIIEKNPDCKLIIVGDGREKEKLIKLTKELHLSKNIKFLGERSDIDKIMGIFDIFVLPSLSEGTSMTILEAMASGLPVIASEVGGNTKLVKDSKNGFLFPLNKPNLLIQRVIDLLTDNEKLETMGLKSRQIAVENFSFDVMKKSYENLYLSLIQN